MSLDVHAILKELASTRPVFHSEADFQHALAWEIHKRIPKADIRLEIPCAGVGHVDCLVKTTGQTVFIELKYKTARLKAKVDGDDYALRNHSAQDIARYDAIKDIRRLEELTKAFGGVGLAIFLTNDHGFWQRASKSSTVDAAFRMHEGARLHGSVGWGKGASAGTMKGRETAISLAGTYAIHWRDYSTVLGKGSTTFRYCVVNVPSPS